VPNQSLQPTWLSRLHLLPVFVCSRFGDCRARRISRHAAELNRWALSDLNVAPSAKGPRPKPGAPSRVIPTRYLPGPDRSMRLLITAASNAHDLQAVHFKDASNPSCTTLRVAHTAHSPDDEVGTFSAVKWVLFRLSRFRQNSPGGSVFDCQMGTFSFDKNNPRPANGSCADRSSS